MPKRQTLSLAVTVDSTLLSDLGVTFDNKGLTLPDDLPINDWMTLTRQFIAWWEQAARWTNRFKWAVSDLLAFGEARYGTKYTQISASLNLSAGTLANWASMARHIPHDDRDERVPHSKAYEAAFLPAEQRNEVMQIIAEAEASDAPMRIVDIRQLVSRYRAEKEGQDPNVAEAQFILSTAVQDVMRMLPPEQWVGTVHYCLIPMIAVGDFGGDLVASIVGVATDSDEQEVYDDDEGENDEAV